VPRCPELWPGRGNGLARALNLNDGVFWGGAAVVPSSCPWFRFRAGPAEETSNHPHVHHTRAPRKRHLQESPQAPRRLVLFDEVTAPLIPKVRRKPLQVFRIHNACSTRHVTGDACQRCIDSTHPQRAVRQQPARACWCRRPQPPDQPSAEPEACITNTCASAANRVLSPCCQ
jgi:hypothetical protein